MAKRKAKISSSLEMIEAAGDADFAFQGIVNDEEVARAMKAAEGAFSSMMRIREKLMRAYQDLLSRS